MTDGQLGGIAKDSSARVGRIATQLAVIERARHALRPDGPADAVYSPVSDQ